MLSMHYSIRYAPDGGFASSQVRDKESTIDVWIPKSQIKDDKISEWIVTQKRKEIENNIMSRMQNAKILDSSVMFVDKNKREVAQDTSITDKRIANGQKAHDELVTKAKSLGIQSIRQNMKSATLRQKIQDATNGTKATPSKAAFDKSSTKIEVGSIVSGKYGRGSISSVLTKSTGYVQVKYENGIVNKEMAFNLKGEDGKYLKRKPR